MWKPGPSKTPHKNYMARAKVLLKIDDVALTNT